MSGTPTGGDSMRKEYDFTGAKRAKDVPHLAKLGDGGDGHAPQNSARCTRPCLEGGSQQPDCPNQRSARTPGLASPVLVWWLNRAKSGLAAAFRWM